MGAGGNLAALKKCGYQVSGFDCMPEAVRHCAGQGLEDVHVHDLEEPWPIENGSVDVVVMLDVLEHIADPVKVLRNARQKLTCGGGIVLTVPACPYLMGPWDRMLGHYRRYSGRLLGRHARAAGLRVVWLSHWNAFTYPAALMIRSLEKLFRKRRSAEFPPVSGPVNSLLQTCARVERGIMRRIPLPIGLSLVGVLKP